MIAALQKIFDSLVKFFDTLWQWITEGIYDFATWAFAQYVQFASLQALKFKLWALNFGWDVARQILLDLNFGGRLAEAFALLPPSAANVLNALGISQCLTLILTAAVTKFVFRFIPGMT